MVDKQVKILSEAFGHDIEEDSNEWLKANSDIYDSELRFFGDNFRTCAIIYWPKPEPAPAVQDEPV